MRDLKIFFLELLEFYYIIGLLLGYYDILTQKRYDDYYILVRIVKKIKRKNTFENKRTTKF